VQRRYLAVITFFLLACSLFSLSQVPSDELTIKNIFSGAGPAGRAPESFAWSPDGKQLTYIQRDDSGERGVLFRVDPLTGARTEVISADKLMQLSPPLSQIREERARDNRIRYGVAAYHWSPDSHHILFDALGQLWYYSLHTATAVHLTSSPDTALNPQFSPDGKRIAFIREHNLVVHTIKDSLDRPLTREKDPNILNGEVPWVYAEELDARSGFAWSPDGKRILFLQADQTRIPTYPLTDWLEIHPPTEMMRYPKAGDPNPVVRLGVIDSDGGKPKWLELKQEADSYIPRFGWIAQDLAYAMVLNRAQTQLDLYFIDTRSGRSTKVLSEKSEPFLELTDGFQVLTGLAQFIWPSWRDGHTHLYLYRYNQNQPLSSSAELVRQITSGDWEVNSVEKVDEPKGLVYLVANKDDDRQYQLYSVPLSGGPLTRITKAPGDHALKFSPGGEYFVDNHSSMMSPPVVSLCKIDGSDCRELFQSRSLESLKLVPPKLVDFKAEDGTLMRGVLYLPAQGPMAANGKFPVILNPYGGPHGQVTADTWDLTSLFDHLLARRGFAILKVDNRGMGNRGRKFAEPVYKRLGELELRDQLAALDQALKQFPQLDSNRVGIWGWSYGGFMTLYSMTHSDVFKAGVAVSPVTDWRFYDSTYTERYMGMPQDNEEAYRKSAPLTSAANLKGKLLLVHGTGDDNVHVQNSIQMTQGFITAGKQFRLMLYPRKTHSISGAETKFHLYEMIQQHFEDELRAK